jgi:hypothetical protein
MEAVHRGIVGRGERNCPATNDLPVTMRLAEPPKPVRVAPEQTDTDGTRVII